MEDAVNNSLPLNIVTFFIPVLFYFLGLNSNFEQFKIIFSEKKSLILGLLFQLFFLPLIGILVSKLFENTIFTIAAVIVLIVPGGHVSGLLTYIKKGNVPLSVFLTSFASMMSPLTIIFWLTFITNSSAEFSINILESFIQLFLFILTPFLLGIFSKIRFQKFTNYILNPLDRFLKILIITVSIWTPIDLAAYVLENIQMGVVISLFSLLMIFVSSRIMLNLAKVETSNKNTLEIEALCQNFPIVLAISIALQKPEVAIYGVIYYVVSMIFAVSYAFSKKF